MNVRDLKHYVEQGSFKHFFSKTTMAFFGDTWENYYVSRSPVDVTDQNGVKHSCWKLNRRRPVNGGLASPEFFDVMDYERVFV